MFVRQSCWPSIKIRLGQLECVRGSTRSSDAVACAIITSTTSKRKKISGSPSNRSQARRAERNATLLLRLTASQRPAEILPRSSFHLHENERVALAADEIDLAAGASAKVAVEDLETVPAQIMRAAQFFSPRRELARDAQMTALVRTTENAAAPPAQTSGGESGKDRVHGVSGDAARFRSPCAG